MKDAQQAGGDAVGKGLAGYVRFLEALTPDSIGRLDAHVTADVRFRDPFNDVHGLAAMKEVFARMFADCTDIAFAVEDVVRNDRRAFLTWTFRFRPKRFSGGKLWTATGVSELHLDRDGRVVIHTDHWDAGSQFYARLPIIGAVIRMIRSRVGIS